MSTIAATTLEERASSDTIPVATVVAGATKAWVCIGDTATTPAVEDGFNVSSITDNGVGDYTVNLTSSLPNATFCVQATFFGTDNNMIAAQVVARAVGSFQLDIESTATTNYDHDVAAAVFCNAS